MKAKNNLKGYGKMYRSGITMKQKWATDRQIAADRKEIERNCQNARYETPPKLKSL